MGGILIPWVHQSVNTSQIMASNHVISTESSAWIRDILASFVCSGRSGVESSVIYPFIVFEVFVWHGDILKFPTWN